MVAPPRRSLLSRLALGVASWASIWASIWATPGTATAAEHTAPIQRPTRPLGAEVASPEPAPAPEPEPEPEPAPAPVASPPPAEAVPSPRAAPSRTKAARGGALHATAEPEPAKERLPHKGFTADVRLGASGCLRSMCTDGHGATTGLRVDGFLGGNIRGYVDLGIAGGWGSFGTSIERDTNLLRLYGIEPGHLQAAAAAMSSPLGFNPFALQVQSARLRTARVGPSLRVHLIPRGRGLAYLGAGLGYSTFLADYDTTVGAVSMRFHGIDVPLQVGGGVQISEHVAAIIEFDYTFNNYPVARFEHPQQNVTLPVALLDSAAAQSSGSGVSDSLPRMWNVSVGLRARF